jgi:DNA replication protein DnaC
MLQNIKEQLIALKLHGMAEALDMQLRTPMATDMDFSERLLLLVQQEKNARENRQLTTLLRQAHLRYPSACIEELQMTAQRGINKTVVMDLARNEWIKRHRNLIITGPTGAGKTWLACAFGVAACRDGIKTSYVRLSRLLHDLGIGRADGSYKKQLEKLSRTELLIIDDWGMSPLSDMAKRDILEIMEDRHNVRSTIISTQYPVSEWHRLIDDPTLADAICDRLVHNAYQLTIKGESMRKVMAETG